MYKLFLNEVQQDVIRGSIGLADGAGTPLKQGQDIPLTGAKRQAEVSEWLSESETERSETSREPKLFSFFSPSCLHFLTFLPKRLWRARPERGGGAQSKRRRGQSWEDKSRRACEGLRVTCSVMLVWLQLPRQPVLQAVRKKQCFPVEWVPEPVHHVDVGQQFPNLCRKNPTEKRAGTREQGWSCWVAACELVMLRLLC